MGVRITDEGRTYTLTPDGIDRLHKICARSAIERRLNLGGDCWLTYHGNGLLTVARQPARDITYQQSNSES